MAESTCYCEKCNRTMARGQFYQSNNKEKYPNDGIMNMCKKCLTMHVDNYNPDTFLWILQEVDVPYVPEEWAKIMQTYVVGVDPGKITGTTVLGRYLSKMKLKQYKDYRWADTENLQEMQRIKIRDTMKRMGYNASEIDEALNKAIIEIPEKPPAPEEPEELSAVTASSTPQDEFESQLTEEDKIYLRLKWGALYKAEEWIKLEQLYNDMMNSYDIQEAGHIDTLKLICKTSLKANQLIDIGDIDGYQKVSKVYNDLMKAGNFTAAQNKTDKGEFINSLAELIEICEKDGFIPRFYQETPNDKVDRTIEDMQRYTQRLVTEEMGLGSMIENALKQIEKDREKENEEEEDNDEDKGLFAYDEDLILQPEDFEELRNLEESLHEEDNKIMKQMLGEN